MSAPTTRPSLATSAALPRSVGTLWSLAKWLSVPPGRIASSTSVFATSAAAVAIVPSPPATRIRFVPRSIARLRVFSISWGSTAARSKPAIASASRAFSAFPHAELRKALRREAGSGKREGGGVGKREEGGGKREEGRGEEGSGKREAGSGKREAGSGRLESVEVESRLD